MVGFVTPDEITVVRQDGIICGVYSLVALFHFFRERVAFRSASVEIDALSMCVPQHLKPSRVFVGHVANDRVIAMTDLKALTIRFWEDLQCFLLIDPNAMICTVDTGPNSSFIVSFPYDLLCIVIIARQLFPRT